MSGVAVDLRCPADSRRLFGRVLADGTIVDGNLIEIACDDCKKTARRRGERIARVLHRFNVLGECVETERIQMEPRP